MRGTLRTSAAGAVVAVLAVLAVTAPLAAAAPAEAAGANAVAHTGGIPLNVRAGASLAAERVGTIPDGRRLAVACRVRGQAVAGHARSTDVWDRLTSGRYVADANVAWRGRPPGWCGAKPAAHLVTVSTGGGPLNLRTGPSAGSSHAGTAADGARIAVSCQVAGQEIAGHVRRTAVWVRTTAGRYVSDGYLRHPAGPRLPACAALAPARPPAAVAPSPAAFIAQLAGPARRGMRRHGVPASVTIAQAILESGWGRSQLAYADRNYFGIKCFGEPGPVAIGCRSYATSECADGRCFSTRATFRVYRSLADSVRDHGRFLAVDNPRYRPAFAHRGAANRFTIAIHRAGYATSPGYAKAIIRLMRQYGLYRFNR